MRTYSVDFTAQRLLSLTGGVTLAITLIYMIQILSAVQATSSADRPILVLNLLELPQTQITDKTNSKPLKQKNRKPERIKPQTKKTAEVKPIQKQTVPDLNRPATQSVENNNESGETTRPPTPVPYFKLTALPGFMHRETPVYPENMRESGHAGTVELEVLIDKTGSVSLITVIRSAGKSFDQAAINAINASSFKPANIDGKPVPAILKIPVRFKLL